MLFLAVAVTCLSPVPASAQLDAGSLIVTVTSPTSGSTVGGTVTVSASVSIIGSLTVVGVQFRLDGANLGAEDTTSPYDVPWNTKTASNGSHTLTAVARDALGVTYESDPVTVTVFNDMTPPSVMITAPTSGAVLSRAVTVTADASDNVGVVGVQFLLDGAALGPEDTSAPYSVDWDTTTARDGSLTCTAVARDAAGNNAASAPVTVTVDNTPPAIGVTDPTDGSTVGGTIPVTAGASDAVGVAAVQFFLDGAAVGTEDTTAPYAIDWDTTTATDGSHTWTAVARDAAGNSAASAPITITVDNTPPAIAITDPASGATVAGTIPVTASASDGVGVAGVQFFVDGSTLGAEDTSAPYSADWDTTTATDGPHTLTAVARDGAGRTTTSAAVTITVANTTEAAVRLEETAAAIVYGGAWAQGNTDRAWSGGTAAVATAGATATLTFSGSGASWIGFRGPQVGIATVYVDGALVATVDGYAAAEEVQAVLFAVDGLPSGTHTIAVETTGTKNAASTDTFVVVDAFDVTGRDTTDDGSTSDTTPPSVGITSPASGATVSGIVTLEAGASDDTGIAGVSFLVNGTQIGVEDTTPPYAVSWDTTVVADGSYSVTALARDAAGNTATSAEVVFTVANGVSGGRIEETSSAVSYTGVWAQGNIDRAWSGGTAAVSTEALARATLHFVGTSVSWIGFRGPQAGIARVFLDGTLASTVDAYATSEELQAVLFTASGLAAAEHTLVIEVTGEQNASGIGNFIVVDAFDVGPGEAGADAAFAPGDLFISLEPGPVQWRRPDGTTTILSSEVGGTGEGMAFDAAGNLYVTRWCTDEPCPGTVEKFDPLGQSLGTVGSGYDCRPHAIVFDAEGHAYVGQAACTGAILKFSPDFPSGTAPTAFGVAAENSGSFWIDLDPDGCTMFYTSWSPNVKRFDVCTSAQLTDFNSAPLPGDAQDLRVLPDGGVLVSSGGVVARLDASGALVQTYHVPEETALWAGLDLVGDGTFWVGNYLTANVYRFDLLTGAVVSTFNTGTGPHTVVAVRVKR